MDNIPMMDNQLMSKKVQNILLKLILEGAFAKTDKLPAEEHLAKSLGVSRSVVRDVLSSFETQGFISRRRGIGTLINRRIINSKVRLDLEKEFLETVAEAGYEPKIEAVNISYDIADELAINNLALESGQDLIKVARIISADGAPAIYCIDHISKHLIKDETYSKEELKEPIFYFLKNYCNEEVLYSLTKILPYIADELIAKVMDISVGTPLFFMTEVGYNVENKPVLQSLEYHRSDILKYTILRKKI